MNLTSRPKIIWIYWHQGWDMAPLVVHKCAESWELLNPDFRIHKLSANDLPDYLDLPEILDPAKLQKMNIVAFSDIIRLHLLERHGGIWVDSTLFCRRPLRQWLTDEVEFYAFRNPGPDRLISVWFLAAVPNTLIISKWCREARKYWSTWKWRRIYYWPHLLFKKLHRKDNEFRHSWDAIDSLPADGPHVMVPFRQKFFNEVSSERLTRLNEIDPPVLKLTYKCLKDGIPENSMIEYILYKQLAELYPEL